MALSRSHNSTANMDKGKLRPLPLPTGGYPPPEVFPEDAMGFRQLDGKLNVFYYALPLLSYCQKLPFGA